MSILSKHLRGSLTIKSAPSPMSGPSSAMSPGGLASLGTLAVTSMEASGVSTFISMGSTGCGSRTVSVDAESTLSEGPGTVAAVSIGDVLLSLMSHHGCHTHARILGDTHSKWLRNQMKIQEIQNPYDCPNSKHILVLSDELLMI